MAQDKLTSEMMEQILDEIAVYSIELEEDPTQIHLGIPYLQRVLARSRSYVNRTQFYMQKVKRYENRLRSEIKILELDLDFKVKEKLADDALVRKQSSIEDRRALAITMLSEEYHNLASKQVELQDVEECFKIIKAKHQELQRTSNDIKTQRNLVKDDMLARLSGGEGYTKPQTGQDRSIPEGLPPPVAARIDPRDILDDSKRPEDMPKPLDGEHASMIADFLNRNPEKPLGPTGKTQESTFIEEMEREAFGDGAAFVSGPTGTRCSVCKEPQFTTPGGPSCKNGHGGADALDETKEDPGPPCATGISYEDLLT